MGRHRSPAAWRRRLVKKMKRKALKFQDDAKTPEECLAWDKVVTWCQSILSYSEIREKGDLGLRNLSDEEMDQIINETDDKK